MSKIRKFIQDIFDKVRANADRETKHPLLKRALAFFIMPLVLLMILEVMHLTNGNAVLLIFTSPFYWLKLLISYVFLLAVQGFFWCITQHTFAAVFSDTSTAV